MATFVETNTEEEQVLTLVQYVATLKKKKDPEGDASAQFSNECTRLIQESRTRDVILKLISDTDANFSDQNDKGIYKHKTKKEWEEVPMEGERRKKPFLIIFSSNIIFPIHPHFPPQVITFFHSLLHFFFYISFFCNFPLHSSFFLLLTSCSTSKQLSPSPVTH
jgi:hypothetical protein